jgi:1-hydroxycarotenoid 3,4-desaturase
LNYFGKTDDRVIIVGAGIAGLVSALLLAADGMDVTVLEKASRPGGKIHQLSVAGRNVDAGPTVLTMRYVFDEIFAEAGLNFGSHVGLQPCDVLARHAWSEHERLDLLANRTDAAEAIAEFAGPRAARDYLEFCRRAQAIFDLLEPVYMREMRPSPVRMMRNVGVGRWLDLWAIAPFTRLWDELGRAFQDPRLRQLFARYATYCGSSPLLAPATLMLVAHAEQKGVWLVDNGMQEIARAFAAAAESKGAHIRCDCRVDDILVENGRVCGVRLATGERLAAEAVIANVEVGALKSGTFGPSVARAVARSKSGVRSYSALTWAISGQSRGLGLARHSIVFSRDYAREFADLSRGQLPHDPTVYICAQDRDDKGRRRTGSGLEPERFLIIVNAPAIPDRGGVPIAAEELALCEIAMKTTLSRSGLAIEVEDQLRTSPADFSRMFPGSNGALYGTATHGWAASFKRPTARSRIPNLYLAGGGIHPGPGLAMAALSGRMAAHTVLTDHRSTRRFHPVAMPGGMSMR